MSVRRPANRRQASRFSERPRTVALDGVVLTSVALLVGFGVVMIASTSMAVAESFGVSRWHFVERHLLFLALAVALCLVVRLLPIALWQRLAAFCLPLSLLVLALPFVPMFGKEVNGATRWIQLLGFQLQVVEVAKLLLIVYVAAYLARHPELYRARLLDILRPLLAVGAAAAILLLQPDMGSAVVLVAIVGGMVWLAGTAWKHLLLLGAAGLPLMGFAAMEPYRLQRIMSFVDPWADPLQGGFQLIQALIAVGRGQVFGVGLGASVQKLYYLPEAHTDFVFAVLAEELGLVGIVCVLGLFVVLVIRIFQIGLRAMRAERPFSAYLAWGIGLWLGIQALVNIGVNLGALPTKGLTLPLISSGGSSLVMVLLAITMVLRIDYECNREALERPRRRQGWSV